MAIGWIMKYSVAPRKDKMNCGFGWGGWETTQITFSEPELGSFSKMSTWECDFDVQRQRPYEADSTVFMDDGTHTKNAEQACQFLSLWTGS